ncbi:phage major capsid protein [Pseudarthrobacter phenanthrenivorans]|uniref:Phage major capsid protein n=1 Tax=Pseudarthrobacter phenanthrenivorans TaxID=361575 RepID=A0A3B0FX46_PSEPS|nr:phage major capsid protein [Pseudarthrobacter phenanthrenivorans]RKO24500.1 phage major capsid protein [Pseudarthrobacter phenanthrenivorans]
MSKKLLAQLAEKRKAAHTKATALLNAAESETRDLTPTEAQEFEGLMTEIDAYRSQAERLEAFEADVRSTEQSLSRIPGGPGSGTEARGVDRSAQWVRTNTMAPAALRSGERFTEHSVVQGSAQRSQGAEAAVLAQYSGMGEMIRALATTGGGTAVIPTTWAGQMIDLARNQSAVMQAGASIIPMDDKIVQIGRLTADPTAAFRAENSLIAASDPTFDNVTLEAKTLSAEVIGSMEWFQDADNAESLVVNALSKALAQRIDLVALYGGITSGAGTINLPTPPNPRGVLAALNATLAANVLGNGANGTTQTAASYWSEVLDTIYTVRDRNEDPTALIWNTKLGRQYAKATDTTGQPLQLPADVEDLPRYSSNQIPTYTQGTMASRATDLFVGDWSQLLIGQRLAPTVKVLTERYAEYGQIGIIIHWRGDVQPARPGAFAVYKAIQGAA